MCVAKDYVHQCTHDIMQLVYLNNTLVDTLYVGIAMTQLHVIFSLLSTVMCFLCAKD